MFNDWLEFYLYFCTITTIFSLYKLYIPCWKQIEKENDSAAKRIKTRPVFTGIVFSLAAFVLAPLFLIITFSESHGKEFVKGFVKGNLGK